MNISIYKYKTKMFFMYTSLLHRLEIEFNNIFYILEISACFFWEIIEKLFCIPESFNTNISHQVFYYTITFVNSQH